MIEQDVVDTIAGEVIDMWNDRGLLEHKQESIEETLFWYIEHLKGRVVEHINEINE